MTKNHNLNDAPYRPLPLGLPECDRLLNVKQVAELTGMSVAYLNRARIYGLDAPPFVKISKAVRYRLNSVSEWANSKTEFTSTSAQQAAD